MRLFDKKKKDDENSIPQAPEINLGVPPTDKIQTMRAQGLDNNQIIQNLQREGYNSDVILNGMNQADITAGIEPVPQNSNNFQSMSNEISNPMQISGNPIATNSNFDNDFNQFSQNQDANLNNNQIPNNLPTQNQFQTQTPQNQLPTLDQQLQPSSSEEIMSIERIEEIAEAIIDEKWNEIVKSINKIIDWKDRTESRIVKIEQRFADMRKNFDTLSTGVLGRIGEYDKNLGDLGIEIKAMEKVFQKVLPGLTENVHALDRIAKDFKGKTE